MNLHVVSFQAEAASFPLCSAQIEEQLIDWENEHLLDYTVEGSPSFAHFILPDGACRLALSFTYRFARARR